MVSFQQTYVNDLCIYATLSYESMLSKAAFTSYLLIGPPGNAGASQVRLMQLEFTVAVTNAAFPNCGAKENVY